MNKIFFTIPGDPVGYLRMTQGQIKLMRLPWSMLRDEAWKIKDKIIKYQEYKSYVRLLSNRFDIDRRPLKKIYLNVMVYFRLLRHPDPGNVRKAVEDAIFDNDNKVAGSVDFYYDADNPRVEIEICGSPNGRRGIGEIQAMPPDEKGGLPLHRKL